MSYQERPTGGEMSFLGAFIMAGAAVAVVVAERLRPLRPRRRSTRRRGRNLALGSAAGLVQATVVLPLAWMVARLRRERGLAALVPGPSFLRDALAFVLLDYTQYLWHRANHRVGWLWRLHAVHHSDIELDASTAARFHPFEIVLSALAAGAQVVLIGPRPQVVLGYSMLMQLASMFHHANIRLPDRLEHLLVRVIVTPRFHNVHHSTALDETNSNWSVVFSAWDRIHSTFRTMGVRTRIGLPEHRDPQALTIPCLLAMPFRAR